MYIKYSTFLAFTLVGLTAQGMDSVYIPAVDLLYLNVCDNKGLVPLMKEILHPDAHTRIYGYRDDDWVSTGHSADRTFRKMTLAEYDESRAGKAAVLIKAGANVYKKNGQGESSCDIATSNRDTLPLIYSVVMAGKICRDWVETGQKERYDRINRYCSFESFKSIVVRACTNYESYHAACVTLDTHAEREKIVMKPMSVGENELGLIGMKTMEIDLWRDMRESQELDHRNDKLD